MDDLKKAFQDEDYKRAYAEGFAKSYLALQLRALRRSRGLSIRALAEQCQLSEQVIARYEKDGESFAGVMSIDHLTLIAHVLGVRVKVSLETFGSLISEAEHCSEEDLWRPTFEEDPVFTGKPAFMPGPRGEMQRKLILWLQSSSFDRQPFLDWMQGYDLPPVGDEMRPYEWVLYALDGLKAEFRAELARRASVIFQGFHRITVERRDDCRENILKLIDALKM